MSKYPGNIITTGADTGYSVYLDGTGDFLNVANNAAFQFGTGDFTVEYWVYYTGGLGATANFPISCWASNSGFELYYRGTATQGFAWYYNSSVLTTGVVPVLNRWYHVACSRSSGTTRVFVDGVVSATLNSDTTNFAPTSQLYVGIEAGTAGPVQGYVSNARIIKGTALYTAAFTPPTQLFNVTNTSFLSCNSPAIVDQSSNAFAITANGNAAVSTFTPFAGYQAYNPALGAATPGVWTVSDALQAASTRQWNMYDPYFNLTTLKLSGTPVTNVPTWITDASTNNFAITANGASRAAGLSPFSLTTYPNSGSGYFDGTTNTYLSAANNAAFSSLNGVAWTVECWAYATSTASSACIIGNSVYSPGAGFNIFILSGAINLYANGSGGSQIVGSTFPTNQWNHVAAVRNTGGQVALFLNGVRQGASNPYTINLTNVASSPLVIGGITASTGWNSDLYLNGYVANARIVKGTAIYDPTQTTITVPTAPLTAVTNTSLLTLQNSQSSNNNSFLDSSSNNFLITRNGGVPGMTQGSFSPFTQTGWSNFFGATTSYIGVSNATLALGTGGFSVTFYSYRLVTGAYLIGTGNTSGAWAIYGDTGNTIAIRTDTLSTNLITGTAPLNQWNKIQFTRVSGVIYLYVNDVLQSSVANTQNFSTSNLGIGSYTQANNFAAAGYISNLTIVKAGTTILDTCRNNRFLDNSSSNFTFTVTGTPSVQAFSPFNTNNAYTPATIGGSGYFDGATDELSMADNAAFDLSSTDFTIEAWVYPTVINATNEICAQWGGAGNAPYLFKIVTAGRLQFVWTIGGGSGNTLTGTTVAAVVNQWNHVAVTRSGGTLSLFVNGVRDGTTGAITGAITNGTNPLYVGSIGGSEYLNGYMSGFRFIKGQALATSNFTPPTAPVNATQVGWNGSTASLTGTVSALLNFTNAGIVDTTGKNVLETVGNVQIVTTQSKYGGSSMYFDGSGDSLRFLNGPNPNFAFGTGDFTIEGWIYLNASSYQDLLDIYDGNSSGRLLFSVNTSRQLVLSGASGANRTTTTTSIPLSTWTHFALCRASSSTRLFIGGVQGNTTLADTTNYTCTTGVVVMGINGFDLASNPLNAYVNDWRISKYARYVANFTPPTSMLQNQ